MSYFTAVIAGDGRSWRARDVDVEDAGSLEDLADILRGASNRGRPVLAVIEREDEWFALVRVDGDDDPRLFVSDMPAASRSSYADLLAPAADVEVALTEQDPAAATTEPGQDEDVEEDGEDAEAEPDDREKAVPDPEQWAGEPDLLEDLGVSGSALRELTVQRSDDPAAVLAEVGEACGFGELLDALR